MPVTATITPGIDPVVKVRAPADDELGDAGILEGLVLRQQGLFGVVVAGAGAGIELRDLRVGDGGCQTEQQGGEDADPHGRRGGGLAGDAGSGLDEEREPKEGAGGDERHCVAGQPGKTQGGLHLRCFLICHEHSPGNLKFVRLLRVSDSREFRLARPSPISYAG